jgi:hypothetical protein
MYGGFLLFGTPAVGNLCHFGRLFRGGSFIALSVLIFVVEDIFFEIPRRIEPVAVPERLRMELFLYFACLAWRRMICN